MLLNQIKSRMFPTIANTAAYLSRRAIGSLRKNRMAMTLPITKASPR